MVFLALNEKFFFGYKRKFPKCVLWGENFQKILFCENSVERILCIGFLLREKLFYRQKTF